jgi:uncharacterized protein Usg
MTIEKPTDFELMMRDWRMTTAEILYHFPDHPALLQTYVWQEMDRAPKFPALSQFIDFWNRELDGKIHSVKVASLRLIQPSDWQRSKGEFLIH